MKRTNKMLIGIALIAVMLLGIGYAAIQNITLNIEGTATADPSQSNFTVRFTGETSVSDSNLVTAEVTNDLNAKINVEGLTAKGDTVTATYVVQNASADLSANLSVETTNSNEEYFTIESKLTNTSLKAGEETTLVVTVELIKTPILATETSTIGVQITAQPVQPGEEGGTEEGGTEEGGSTEEPPIENVTTMGTYLPTGFREVAEATSTTGLTIADSQGNEYVWIEVPQTVEVYPTAGLSITEFNDTELAAIEADLHTYTRAYRNTSYSDTYYSDETTGLTESKYYELKGKMLKSVYQNGGFYVGKYETGTTTERTDSSGTSATPVIKANAYPYTYVTCSQAQTIATGMESGEYTSSLLFGVQWDLVLRYLEAKGTEESELNVNSTSWGNYKNNLWHITNAAAKYFSNDIWYNITDFYKTTEMNLLLTTGADSWFSKQGIYDLGGNVFEWTLEHSSSTSKPCTSRGGGSNNPGNTHPSALRCEAATDYAFKADAFRVCIY